MRLLHLTDPHLHADPAARLRGVDTAATLRGVLGHALAEHRPDALLVTGDIAQDETPGAYGNLRRIVEPAGVPAWCVPGNHDAPDHMRGALDTAPFRLGGCIVAPPWCVVLLDSRLGGDHGGRLAAGELAALRRSLESHRGLHTLVALHHHPLPVGSRWLDALGLYNAAELFAVLDDHPQVRAVVCGHVHQASDQRRGTVRYLSTPSTCFQFAPGLDRFAVDVRPPGYRWLELLPDGTIGTEVAWVPLD